MAETTHPYYYQRGSVQVWDFIRDQRLNFHLGNAIKYICRYGHKGDYNAQLSDLNKAIHYLENERDHLQRSRNSEDLFGRSYNPTIFSSSGVPGGLQDIGFEVSTRPEETIEFNNRGIQGVSTSGWDVI